MSRWVWTYLPLVGLLLIGGNSNAEDERARRAREEVERELRNLVSIPAPRISIELVPLDEPNLRCQSIELLLDGRVLPLAANTNLNAHGPTHLYRGEVSEGRHELISRVEYEDTSSVMFSENAGVKWKVSSSARFETQNGLEIVLKIAPERVPGEKDLRKAIRVKQQRDVNMVATVDTTIPPPLPKHEEASTDAGSVTVAQAEPPAAPPKRRRGAMGTTQAVAQDSEPAERVVPEKRRRTKQSAETVTPVSAPARRPDPRMVAAAGTVPSQDVDVAEQDLEPVLTDLVVDAGAPVADLEVLEVLPDDRSSSGLGLWPMLAAGIFAVLALGAVVVVRRRR